MLNTVLWTISLSHMAGTCADFQAPLNKNPSIDQCEIQIQNIWLCRRGHQMHQKMFRITLIARKRLTQI